LESLDVDLLEHSVCFRDALEALKALPTNSIAVVGCGAAFLVLDAKRDWVEL
jgi:hypothetical protein